MTIMEFPVMAVRLTGLNILHIEKTKIVLVLLNVKTNGMVKRDW